MNEPTTARETIAEHQINHINVWKHGGYSAEATALALNLSEFKVRKYAEEAGSWGTRGLSERVRRILVRPYRADGLLENYLKRTLFILNADPDIKEPVLRLGLGTPQNARLTCLQDWMALHKLKRWARGRVTTAHCKMLAAAKAGRATPKIRSDGHPGNNA